MCAMNSPSFCSGFVLGKMESTPLIKIPEAFYNKISMIKYLRIVLIYPLPRVVMAGLKNFNTEFKQGNLLFRDFSCAFCI